MPCDSREDAIVLDRARTCGIPAVRTSPRRRSRMVAYRRTRTEPAQPHAAIRSAGTLPHRVSQAAKVSLCPSKTLPPYVDTYTLFRAVGLKAMLLMGFSLIASPMEIHRVPPSLVRKIP